MTPLFGRKKAGDGVSPTGGRGLSSGEKMLRARVIVEGMVQGVYYRVYARNKAQRLGVNGWVRNLPDGRVEAVIEGNEPSVRAMIEWCHRGSPKAVVDKVTVTWEPYAGDFERFSVRDSLD